MKSTKKKRGLIASLVFGSLVLTGCSLEESLDSVKNFLSEHVWSPIVNVFNGEQKQDKKEDDKKEETPDPVVKQDVTITIAMEDGKQYNEGEFVAPQISVNPSSLTPVVTYYQGEQAVNGTPQTVGDYKIVAKTEENENYNAGLASKNFLIRKVPTITFFYGNDNPLEADHQFDLAVGDYNIYAKSSVEGANFTYSYLDQNGTAVNGKPNSPGTYYFVASVERTNTIGSASKSIRFNLVDSSSGIVAVDPVIKFFYNGQEACLESNWLVGGYADSQFFDSEFDITKLSYTVDPANATYVESWTLNDQPVAKPTANPLAAGTYALTITVSESEVAHAAVKWAGFVIKSSAKVDPTIKFFYNGEEKCLESNWLDEGYAQSQYDASAFDITKLTFTVDPSNAQYVESWTRKALDAPENAEGQPIEKPTTNPLQSGIYAVTITVTESATVNAGVKWAGFVITGGSTPQPGKQDPVIKFFYDGAEKCLESNWLDGGFAQSHYDAANFDINKLTYTVDPQGAQVTESWSLKALDAPEEVDGDPINKPTNPLAGGIYSVRIDVAEGANNKAGFKWAGFVINASSTPTEKVKPTFKFFYDGVEKCLESNWLDEGFAASHYDASAFDINKLTYTVDPQDSPISESWTLKALDAPEEAEGNPINKPSNPLAPGIYSLTVAATEGEHNLAGFKWAGFVINDSAPAKQDPVIQFFYDGAEKCISGSRWLNEGYGDSQFRVSEFDVSKLTYTVTPEATATVSWTLNDAPITAPSNPLAAGTYAMTVSVAASDTVNAGSAYALFAIKADKADPVIRFFYDGAEKCISGSNWLNEGYGDTQFFANEFDVSKLTYTVTPELEATVSWTLDEAPIAAPTNPLAAGTYAMTVSVAAGEDNNSAVKWALFAIKEAPQKQDPVIQFFYDGAEKCISGSRWLNEGYGDSQFRISEFDISKLTYTVSPEATATVSWTLDEAPIAAPTAPLAVGTYAMTVTVEANDTVNAGSAYALFAIKADKADPVIRFFYDGAEKCISGSNWLNEGYGDSQFFANEFDVSKLTYTVTPELEATVSWTLDEAPIAAPTNPLAAGTYAMTVSVAAGEDNNSAVKWALFAIKEALPTPGSEQLPYTVAEARAAIDAGEGMTDVYTAGIVTTIAYSYSTSSKNMSFYFSDDGTKTNEIEAYKLSADTDPNVEVGDYVVVRGNLTKYQSTYEVNSGCTLAAHTKATVESVVISGTATQTEYSVNAAYNHNGLKATAHLSTGVDKDVTSDAAWTINPATASIDDTEISITATYKNVTSEAFKVNVSVTNVQPSSVYTKATSIAIGDTVSLACESASKYLSSISSTSTKYGIGSDIPSPFAESVFALTVVAGSEEGTFAFKTSDNKYLCWTSGNSLNVSTTLNANSSWDVTIDSNGNATILNHADNARQIWWNVGSPRFACYTGKTDGNDYKIVQLYKLAD